MSALHRFISTPRAWAAAAMVTAGLAGGAVLGSTMTAGAVTTTPSTSATAPAASTATAPAASAATDPAGGGYHVPGMSGTVTAVGANSVTISGTTYAVTSSSDIDKDGEAALSSLAVGDAVTFSTDASAAAPTIDKLHAGTESLDRPSGPPPAGAPSTGSTGTTAG